MAEQKVTVTLIDKGADVEAEYTNDITTITVRTRFTWNEDDGHPFTVEQLREAPAKLAMSLLAEVIAPPDQ